MNPRYCPGAIYISTSSRGVQKSIQMINIIWATGIIKIRLDARSRSCLARPGYSFPPRFNLIQGAPDRGFNYRAPE